MTKQSERERQMFGGFYKGKSILVTGHTGFKGSWLALWLHELGATVAGFALPPHTDPSHFKLIGLQNLVRHIEGDTRDLNAVKHAFDSAKPEIVFHLAARPIVRESYDDPKATLDTNIGGTVNVLEAIRHCQSVKAAVVVTSDKCYENMGWGWGYRENDPMGGHDPYSASKGATEIICSAYRRSFFDKGGRGPHLGLATARAGNVIGGGDWAKDRIIPDCIRALSRGEPISVRNPDATRPWQHVLDPLTGYLQLAARLYENPEIFGGAWNFGPRTTDQITVRDLAERFIASWGKGSIHTPNPKNNECHEDRLLHLSIDKAAFELKWKPVLDSTSSIDWTVHWYKFWHERNRNIQGLSVRQIREFHKRVLKNGHSS
jgi:CDP-glucose 4,6-dehydratase